MIQLLFAALVLVGSSLVSAGAAAHAVLTVAEPADGDRLSAPPRQAILRFSEPVSPLSFRLLKPNGEIVRLSDIGVERQTVSVRLPVDVGEGASILNWRVTSADGHPVGGTVTFNVGGRAGVSEPGGAAAPTVTTYRTLAWATSFATLICLVTSVGAAVFRSWIFAGPGAADVRVAAATAGLGLASLAAQAGVSALDLTGLTPDELAFADAWGALTAGSLGIALALHAAAFALVLCCRASGKRRRTAKAASAGAALAAVAGFAFHGHASVADPTWLTRPAISLHVAGAILWVGSFAPLLIALRSSVENGLLAFAHVSRPIFVAALAVAATGPAIAAVQLGSVDELWNSAYGAVLLLKLLFVAPMFVLGAVNRFVLSPALVSGQPSAAGRLRKSVTAELVLGAFAIAALGLWRFTPPPRTMETVVATVNGLQFHAHGVRAMANLTLSPARVGQSRITVTALNIDATPLAAKGVSVALFDPSQRLEPLKRDAVRVTDSTWAIEDAPIPRPGLWTVRVDILVSDFEKASVRTAVMIVR